VSGTFGAVRGAGTGNGETTGGVMRRSGLVQYGVVIAGFALNAFVILQITGVAYEPFSWKVFAFVYNTENTANVYPDYDHDGIRTSRDLNDHFFNPSGCFYDSKTGQIVAGGMVVSANDQMNCNGGSADCHVYIPDGGDPMDGSQGCYSFLLKAPPPADCASVAGPAQCVANGELPAPIMLAITVPDGCAIDTLFCPRSGATFSPPANANDLSEPLGSPPDGSHTALEGAGFPCPGDPGCECPNNPWYTGIDLSQSTSPDNGGTAPHIPVVHNNIPLLCNTPLGGDCVLDVEPSNCESGFCAERDLSNGPGGICCDAACNAPFQACDMSGREGECVTTTPAPVLSPRGWLVLFGVLLAVAAVGLWRRRAA
jgi:hypothetical protein